MTTACLTIMIRKDTGVVFGAYIASGRPQDVARKANDYDLACVMEAEGESFQEAGDHLRSQIRHPSFAHFHGWLLPLLEDGAR